MSGFVAGGTAVTFSVTNDGFWPDIDANDLRASLRLDGAISDKRLKVATVNAILSVNRELAAYRAAQQAAGHASAAAVPGEQVDGETLLVHRYRRAVYCTAGAELSERYRSFDATGSGNQRADELTPSIDEYRRDARWAISDILGKPRTTVELI